MSDHRILLEVLENLGEHGNSARIVELTENVGHLMLQQRRRVLETWRKQQKERRGRRSQSDRELSFDFQKVRGQGRDRLRLNELVLYYHKLGKLVRGSRREVGR